MEHDYALEWFRFAGNDLKVAEHLLTLHPQPYEIICYHCQQSAEKYLKGFLVYNGVVEPPKTHNLDTLSRVCAEYDDSFGNIKEPCAVLSQYGVQPRYPHEMEVTEYDMKKALAFAQQIKDLEPLQRLLQQP